jgi:hypothetical protein
MENEKNLVNIDGQEPVEVEEAILSEVSGAGTATSAVAWGGANAAISGVIANHQHKNVDNAVATGFISGAAVSIAVDTAFKFMSKGKMRNPSFKKP